MAWLIIILVLFASGGWIVPLGFHQEYVYLGLLYLLTLFLILRHRGFFDRNKWLFIMAGLVVITSFFNDYRISGKEITLVLKIIAVYFVLVYTHRFNIDWKRMFVDFMYWLSWISLAVYAIVLIFPDLLIRVYADYSTFLGLSYFRDTDMMRFGLYRNQAFFWEAGVFGVFLIMAYIFNYYHYRRYSPWIFYLAVASTFSVGACGILAALVIGQKLVKSFNLKKSLAFASAGIIMFILIYSYPVEAVGLVNAVFHRDILNDGSTMVRFYDLKMGLAAAWEKPFFGHGFDDYSLYQEMLETQLGYVRMGGISNSLVDMLYKYGLFVTGLYIYLVLRFVRRNFNRDATVLFLALIMLLMFEPLAFSLFFMLLLFDQRQVGNMIENQTEMQSSVS